MHIACNHFHQIRYLICARRLEGASRSFDLHKNRFSHAVRAPHGGHEQPAGFDHRGQAPLEECPAREGGDAVAAAERDEHHLRAEQQNSKGKKKQDETGRCMRRSRSAHVCGAVFQRLARLARDGRRDVGGHQLHLRSRHVALLDVARRGRIAKSEHARRARNGQVLVDNDVAARVQPGTCGVNTLLLRDRKIMDL